MVTTDFIPIAVGLLVLAYVGYCLINQRVWIDKKFSWGERDDYPKVFMGTVILGTLIGAWTIVSALVF